MGVMERQGPPSLACHDWAWVGRFTDSATLEPALEVNE